MEDEVLFNIDPEPRFWAPVKIPLPGGKTGTIQAQFLHLGREEYIEFWKRHEGRPALEVMQKIVFDWKGPDAGFSPETLARLLNNYGTASRAFFDTWRENLFGAAEKN